MRTSAFTDKKNGCMHKIDSNVSGQQSAVSMQLSVDVCTPCKEQLRLEFL